jgi:hypothetical protein
MEWEPQSGAIERLIGGRRIAKKDRNTAFVWQLAVRKHALHVPCCSAYHGNFPCWLQLMWWAVGAECTTQLLQIQLLYRQQSACVLSRCLAGVKTINLLTLLRMYISPCIANELLCCSARTGLLSS